MSKAKKTAGLVFDDDTSDSDEELDAFRKSARKVAKQNKHDVEESDSEDEDISEEVSDDDDEDDDLSESETERKDDSAIKAKLGKLGSMLKNVKEDDSGDEDDAEDDDDDDADNSNDEDDDSSVENENNQEHGDSDSPEDDIDSEQSEDERKKPDKKVKKSLKRSADQDVVNPKKKKVLSEEEEREQYKNQLSKLSVEEILKIKSSLGDKVFNNKWQGGSKKQKEKDVRVFKRENKNRPREESSKKRVRKLVKVVQETKVEKRDPRFDPLCGEFDKAEFRKSYKFLNGVKENELKLLKSQLKEASKEEREKLRFLIQRHENQIRAERQRLDKEKAETEERRERKEKINRGEAPIFKTKKVRREEDLVATYEGLKEKGGLDNYIRKKNKKNTARDRKTLGKAYDG